MCVGLLLLKRGLGLLQFIMTTSRTFFRRSDLDLQMHGRRLLDQHGACAYDLVNLTEVAVNTDGIPRRSPSGVRRFRILHS